METHTKDIPVKNITIADVAKAAEVSLGTVSRVLNNRDGKIKISDKTRDKVLNAAKELGYKPNPFASALRTHKTGVIGAIIRDIGDPFLRQIIGEVQRVCHSKGIELLIGHAGYETETAERQINLMLNHWFDGLIMIGNLSGEERLLRDIQEKRTPIVTIASGYKMDMPAVNYNNLIGSKAALKYLYGLGHRRIAFIGNLEFAGVRERNEVYLKFIKEHSLFYVNKYNRPHTKSKDAITATKEVLSLPNPPTAIFCGSDALALGTLNASLQMGLHIPKDISVIGYDDIEEAAYTYPPLTTIRQPIDVAAEKAVEMLLNLMDNSFNNNLLKDVQLEPELIIRESCAKPKGV